MSGDPIGPRILRYLKRQREWLEARIDEVSVLRANEADETLEETLQDIQSRRTGELETFQREQNALYREWEAAGDAVTDADRQAVRAEAEACARLTGKLAAVQTQILQALAERQAQGEAGMGAIRKGRQAVRGYGGDDEPTSSDMDRRA